MSDRGESGTLGWGEIKSADLASVDHRPAGPLQPGTWPGLVFALIFVVKTGETLSGLRSGHQRGINILRGRVIPANRAR